MWEKDIRSVERKDNMDKDRIKHLEFIERVIERMNQCSFRIKELMGVVLTAILAVYATTYSPGTGGKQGLLTVALIPEVLFWVLDAYYLYKERQYREVYKAVAGLIKCGPPIAFDMSTKPYKRGLRYYLFALFSKTEWPIYITTIILLVISSKVV